MAKRVKNKSTDTISKHVKNTKTRVDTADGPSLRWYHVVATVVVLALAVLAMIRVFSRFDSSLIGSEYSLRYATGCTGSIAGTDASQQVFNDNEYRYAGIKVGDMLGTDGVVTDENDAYVKIVEFGSNKVTLNVRNASTNEWSEEQIRYGEEYTAYYDPSLTDCMMGISFTINK